ncbi:MAG: acyltransferase, partial [Pseudomonadota bacterium]
MTRTLPHLPHIDGLRAIAILPVVGFHAGLSLAPGGFIGVDIFFVISGYLIAGIIAREMAEGRFSLLDFYERRVRRIVPALMAML